MSRRVHSTIAVVAIALAAALAIRIGTSSARKSVPPASSTKPHVAISPHSTNARSFPTGAEHVKPKPPNSLATGDARYGWLTCDSSRTDAGVAGCFKCERDDCSSDEACALNRLTGQQECVGSDCESDQHCSAGWHCRHVAMHSEVKRCVEAGILALGEWCATDPWGPEHSCGEGLLCASGICSTPCDPAKAESCPATHSCVKTEDGFACERKGCREVGCPDGGDCIPVARGGWACARRTVGENCIANPCPNGETCQVRENGDVIGFRCRKPCDPWKPDACPRGWVCGRENNNVGNVCYLDCAKTPTVCRENHDLCSTVTEDQKVWGCTVDVMRPAEALRKK